MRKKINSKQKGKRIEREVVNYFKKKFPEDADKWMRVPDSGARMGGKNLPENASVYQKITLVGDIITPEWVPFNIECKGVSNFDLFWLLQARRGKLWRDWEEELHEQFLANNRKSILILKANRKPMLVIVPLDEELISVDQYSESLVFKGKYEKYVVVLLNDYIDIDMKRIRKEFYETKYSS